MSLEQFTRLAREIGGKSMAVSLYYVGDPLVHPDLDAMCGVARDARLNVHISSNFSFGLSDERIERLVTSGLTHLTVCVDAMRQETYERTRVGGKIAVVLNNLERVMRVRRALGQRYPKMEVQFIKFQHNVGELEEAARWCAEQGVDQFTDYWGNLHNYADTAPGTYSVFGPKRQKAVPHCSWPHFALQVKYNGDVIPCCYYREADQYRTDADSRVVGNVFQTSVWEVWNSPEYKLLRRIVSNPERVLAEPGLAETFCQGCPTLFETDSAKNKLSADKHRWEDIYLLDEQGRVSRQ
jgi:MoaA/NifB/PqqE/SkfB family radical SAM enzyme